MRRNRAAAAQLVAIGGLFAQRLAESPDEAREWAIDTMEATAAEVGAGLRISQGRAATKVHYARVMRERLPMTAQVFCAGDIDLAAFATIASRTDLIDNAEVLAQVDALVAANVTRWPSLSRGRLGGHVDWIVARVDADAVRCRDRRHRSREIFIGDDSEGICLIEGNLATPDARALDQRLSALAATVCPHDPRTRIERRADALGALAAGAGRLGCRCARTDCTAGARRPAGPVTIHVIAEQTALTGIGTAAVIGADALITAQLVAELAATAKHVPLTHPGDTAPEPGYRPSAALADFVRARDLTCRWPGCDVPATHCDPRSFHSARRRRTYSRRQPELQMPRPSPREDLLGLARTTTTRRHPHLHHPSRRHPRHHPWQRPDLPQPVHRRRRHAQPRPPAQRLLR